MNDASLLSFFYINNPYYVDNSTFIRVRWFEIEQINTRIAIIDSLNLHFINHNKIIYYVLDEINFKLWCLKFSRNTKKNDTCYLKYFTLERIKDLTYIFKENVIEEPLINTIDKDIEISMIINSFLEKGIFQI